MTLISRLEHNVDRVDIVWLCDPDNPARGDQGISAQNYHYHLSALLPLAHVNPHLGSFMLMDSPEALESYVTDNLYRPMSFHQEKISWDYDIRTQTILPRAEILCQARFHSTFVLQA